MEHEDEEHPLVRDRRRGGGGGGGGGGRMHAPRSVLEVEAQLGRLAGVGLNRRAYFGQAWALFRANWIVLVLVQWMMVIVWVLLNIFLILLRSVIEYVFDLPDEAVTPGSVALDQLDLQRQLAVTHKGVLLLDWIIDYLNFTLLYYPAVCSFFYAIFSLIRRSHGDQVALSSVQAYMHDPAARVERRIRGRGSNSSSSSQGAANGADRLIFSDFFSHFPTSARLSYPFRAASILFFVRCLFLIVDYLAVAIFFHEEVDVLYIVVQTLVWVPYLYFLAFSCWVLVLHSEYPFLGTKMHLAFALRLTTRHALGLFWHLLLSLMLLLFGIMLFFVGFFAALPVVLIAFALMHYHVFGVASDVGQLMLDVDASSPLGNSDGVISNSDHVDGDDDDDDDDDFFSLSN